MPEPVLPRARRRDPLRAAPPQRPISPPPVPAARQQFAPPVQAPQAWYPTAPAYAPPFPSQPRGNGLAVAALVLGIVGSILGLVPLFFFVALPCGLLALVFGIVGVRKVATGRTTTGKGMGIAGALLGFLALGLGIIGVAIVNDAVNDLDTAFEQVDQAIAQHTGPADPSLHTASTDTCAIDQFGLATATGTIVNATSENRSFVLTASYTDASGVQLGTGMDFVNDLAPGATARWEAMGSVGDASEVTCSISSVDNA